MLKSTRHSLAKSSGFRWDVGVLAGVLLITLVAGDLIGTRAASASATPSQPALGMRLSLITADGDHTCGLASDANPVCWGKDSFGESADSIGGQATFVSGAPRGVDLATASDHTCEVTLVRTVWCWGLNATGELGRPGAGVDERPARVAGLPSVGRVAVASFDSCIVSTAGAVWCWGLNNYHQLGTRVGSESWKPRRVDGISRISSISVSYDHVCALGRDGSVWCWGSNYFAQSGGRYHSPPSAGPDHIHVGARSISVATSFGTSCSLRQEGGVMCWGSTLLGLSEANSTAHVRPRLIAGTQGASKIWMNQALACIMNRALEMSCWGWDGQSDLLHSNESPGVPFDPNVTRVPALDGATGLGIGIAHVCELSTRWTARCWGTE